MPGYDVDVSNFEFASFFNLKKDFSHIVKRCLESTVKAVFFHGLFFEWQKILLRKIGSNKKAIWVMWGGDLYNPITQGAPMREEVSLLYGVASWQEKDYEFFLKHYGEKRRVPFRYAGQLDFYKDMEVPCKEKIIIVGNSGDSTNNHVEILENLSRFRDIRSYKIILPFGYNGSPEYLSRIMSTVAELSLVENVVVLDKMLSKEDYYSLIAKAEFLIFAHNRQQGGGNITAALFFGTKVIMRERLSIRGEFYVNSLFYSAVNNGHHVFSYETHLENNHIGQLGDITHPEFYDLSIVRNKMKDALFSSEKENDIVSGLNFLSN
ncbi:hypothetical protein PZ78_01440 [Vreelandella venusta]|nr:hypothetical protein PZ78_01440 [Halomonas hydrothermalis]